MKRKEAARSWGTRWIISHPSCRDSAHRSFHSPSLTQRRRTYGISASTHPVSGSRSGSTSFSVGSSCRRRTWRSARLSTSARAITSTALMRSMSRYVSFLYIYIIYIFFALIELRTVRRILYKFIHHHLLSLL